MAESLKGAELIVAQCEELQKLVTTMKISIEETMTTVAKDMAEWSKIKKNLEKTTIQGVIVLNVGGREFQTSLATLTREKDTLFTMMFSEEWDLEKDDKGRVFLDRNGDLFAEILDYMRSPNEFILPQEDRLRRRLISEAMFYHLNSLLKVLTEPDRKEEEERKAPRFLGSTLLTKEQQTKLNEFYGSMDQHWELIYKATRDGFGASAFHHLCDNQGPTMSIIQSGHCLFGGYASEHWTISRSYSTAANSFLFLLTNASDSPPTKFIHTGGSTGMYHQPSYGPTFGNGHDLHICDDSNVHAGSFCYLPSTYQDTLNLGNNTFTGSEKFQTNEIEVFKLLG